MNSVDTPNLGYSKFIDAAMRDVVKNILLEALDNKEQEVHFIISFSTSFKGVKIPKYLLEEYSEDMTIVLQYQFDDLKVSKDSFSVVLTFNGKKEKLTIPFMSLISFVDPRVNFGLKFSQQINVAYKQEELNSKASEAENLALFKKPEEKKDSTKISSTNAKDSKNKGSQNAKNTNVISIDSFRNNKNN